MDQRWEVCLSVLSSVGKSQSALVYKQWHRTLLIKNEISCNRLLPENKVLILIFVSLISLVYVYWGVYNIALVWSSEDDLWK